MQQVTNRLGYYEFSKRDLDCVIWRHWVGGWVHFSSGCSPYPAPWRLLRGPAKALLQLLPPCYQPDPQLPSYRRAVAENTGRWGTSLKLGEGVASGQGQRGTQATGLTVPSLTWPWSAGPVSIPSDSAKDLFLLEGTECYLHPVCSRPGVWKLDTGPGGDRYIPESHSSCGNGCWKHGLTLWQLFAQIYGPFRTQRLTAPLGSNSQNAAAFDVFKTFKK